METRKKQQTTGQNISLSHQRTLRLKGEGDDSERLAPNGRGWGLVGGEGTAQCPGACRQRSLCCGRTSALHHGQTEPALRGRHDPRSTADPSRHLDTSNNDRIRVSKHIGIVVLSPLRLCCLLFRPPESLNPIVELCFVAKNSQPFRPLCRCDAAGSFYPARALNLCRTPIFLLPVSPLPLSSPI